jgi:hypothetical protein
MTIAFTICSNNYLAHAKTLGDSYLKHHPDHRFIIGLVDTLHESFDYSVFNTFEIIPVAELNIPEFDELNSKYNIVELNTAVKPTYFHYIFEKYKPENLMYIDPDILVVSPFEEVLDLLKTKNIIITPHICTPVEDEFAPTDYHTLRGGIFNLGFIALSNYTSVKGFLSWWHDRVVKYGFADFAQSMFYDQLWINYVPVFYDNYAILKHPGYNMANWNLHERALSENGATFSVNEIYPLRFFHFSSYKFQKPEVICAYLSRYDFNSRPDLVNIFKQYQSLLIENQVDEISNLPVFYYPELNKKAVSVHNDSYVSKIASRIKRSVKILIKGVE